MNAKLPVALFFAAVVSASAAPRTSASYSITAETTDAGGGRASSVRYAHHGGAGSVVGVSTVAAPAQIAKHGYLAQIFEVTALTVNAAAPTVNEGASVQLGAWQLLDDATFLRVDPLNVAWSPAVTPIAAIDAGGLATAELVYQDTPATVEGAFGGFQNTFGLTVLNVNPDDFGTYAGDGLGDDWQVQYFGFDNPLAAPGFDPDGDGQANLFEFIAGLVPTDPASVFRLRIENVPGQPDQKNLIFSPRLPDRTYLAKARPDLLDGLFTPLESFSFTDDGDERTITDFNAVGLMKFYVIEITKP